MAISHHTGSNCVVSSFNDKRFSSTLFPPITLYIFTIFSDNWSNEILHLVSLLREKFKERQHLTEGEIRSRLLAIICQELLYLVNGFK